MLQRYLVVGLFVSAGLGFAPLPETHARPSGKPAKGERVAAGLFGLDKVWQVHLDVPAAEFEKMQPTGGPGGSGGPGRFLGMQQPQDKPADPNADVHKGSGFGVQFPYGKGSISVGPEKFANVGLRYKGNASYMASRQSLKRSMKVELDHFNENGPRFHELKKLNLNAGAMDPTKGREALAFAAYRAAGIPSPRTAYAEVTLTVPGKYDREYLGLYTVIEQVDKTFLKDRFGSNKGLLMKPERLRGIDYLGENWDAYKARYQPKHDATPEQAKRVIDFTRLVAQANDEQFAKEIGSYLDVDEFLRFLATTAMLSNLDSVLTMGHNFYIYLNPTTDKLVFLPWDMDLSFAGFPMGGSADQQLDLSLMHPYVGQNKLIDRLLAIPAVNDQYRKLLKDLAATVFSKEKLLADIDTIEKATKEVREKEAKAAANRKESAGGFGFGPGGGMFGRSPDLKTFVEKRTTSITAQLSGESKGYTPTGRGPGGRGGPGGDPGGGFMMPAIGDVLPAFLQEMVAVTDAQKKQLADVQKEVDAKLDRILTADQKAQLKRMR
ncbi:MAG TPA: CotH kinase family protein, partial [Gemmataceae bacterium]|nr:CotH kinase family protein [Gemmataceae bacterium]